MKLLMLSRVTEAGKLLEEAAVANGLEVQVVDPGKITIIDGDDGKQHFYYVKSVEEPEPVEITKPDMMILRDGTVDMFVKFTITKMFPVPTYNDYQAIENCRHKYMTQVLLNQAGIKTPKSSLITDVDQLEAALKFLGDKYPKIIKTVTGSKGVGVIKVDSKGSLKSVLQVVLMAHEEVMLQEMLVHTEDYRILTIGDQAVAAVRREIQKDEFRSNLDHSADKKGDKKETDYQDKPVDKMEGLVAAVDSDGKLWVAEEQENEYKPTEKELALSIKIAQLLGCQVSAIDYAIDGDDIILFEVNTSPGLEGIQSVNKSINIADLMIKHLIQMAGGQPEAPADVPAEAPAEPEAQKEPEQGAVIQSTDDGKSIHIPVTIKQINNDQPLEAKIDTGAQKSWLHGEDVKIVGDMLKFKLNEVTYSVPLKRTASLDFAGGTHRKEDLPVVSLDIVYDGKTAEGIEFIVGPRENKWQVLLGRNALVKLDIQINMGNPKSEQE